MKIYCLLSTESGPLKSSATVDPFLYHEEAQSAMRATYERKLTALPFDVSLQTDWPASLTGLVPIPGASRSAS